MTTVYITEFLLQRIAEEDASAWGAAPWSTGSRQNQPVEYAAHMDRWSPMRVLDECKAKRRIVRQARAAIALSDETPDDDSPQAERIHGAATAYEYVLLHLVRPYANHPDYQQEWDL